MSHAQEGAAGSPVRIHIRAGRFELAPLVFDQSTSASELWLVGEPGAELSSDAPTLFTLLSGAPPIHLRDLRIASPIAVDAGQLNVLRCTFVPGSGAAQQAAARALSQTGGGVAIEHATFANLTAGAIALTHGGLSVSDSLFLGNAADDGGAVSVHGGQAVLTRCRLASNSAISRGGALFVEGGITQLRNQTLLQDNTAPTGRSIFFDAGWLSYTLPAPLARYLFIESGDSLQLPRGAVEVDYPFACPGGVHGSSFEPAEQSGPWCSGICPSGYRCPGGTEQPLPCPRGSYCPLGSASGTPCPAGGFSNVTGLDSVGACHTCTPGHFCNGGVEVECPANTWNDEYGQASQFGCKVCPR